MSDDRESASIAFSSWLVVLKVLESRLIGDDNYTLRNHHCAGLTCLTPFIIDFELDKANIEPPPGKVSLSLTYYASR